MGSLILDRSDGIRDKLKNKGVVVESTLEQCLFTFRELLHELNLLHAEYERYKTEMSLQIQKCESKVCSSSEELKKVIDSKDSTIQLAASAVTRLMETNDQNIVNEIMQILCGEVPTLTPPKDSEEAFKVDMNTPLTVKKKLLSPNKDFLPLDEVSIKDESITEIDGTPGRISPIMHPKKLKSTSSSSLSGISEQREKKKCPDNWLTPESKQAKLCLTKSVGKSRQSKLCFIETKASSVVDLTSSPEFSGGARNSQTVLNNHVQKLIKKESSDNDDTILPSPTSSCGPPNFLASKTNSKENQKLKKSPLSLLKLKHEPEDEPSSPIIHVVEPKLKDFMKNGMFDESINILKPNSPKKPRDHIKLRIRIEESPKKIKQSPKKQKSPVKVEQLGDETRCDASMSILQQVAGKDDKKSPTKRPLAENMNFTNLPPTQCEAECSMSVLRPEAIPGKVEDKTNIKRKPIENVEPVYKEPAARKKAEKLALPGWCCDECKAFFGHLYANDPEKIKAVIERCSKHRGRNNPIRPKTPPGFWNPRWDVPEDTEEFNKRNDAG